MSGLDQDAVTIDVELFDLIALCHKSRHKDKKGLLKRLKKFVMTTDLISGCLLIVAMPCEVLSDLVEYSYDIVPHVVRFTKTHTIPSVHRMLGVRYERDFNRLKLRVSAEKYDAMMHFFKGD